MNKPFKTILLAAFFLILSFSFVALARAQVQADNYGLETAAGEADLKKSVAGATNVPQLIGKIVGAGLSLLGIIFFILILYAGIRWMTAMGKTEDVERAKNTIEAAVLGLVIVLAAYAISKFVFSSLVGSGGGGGETNEEITFTCAELRTKDICTGTGNCVWTEPNGPCHE